MTVPNVSPAGVSSLDAARIERSEAPAGELLALRRKLDTERSAGKAMLVTVLELDGQLQSERKTGQALLATVRALETSLEQERQATLGQRFDNQRLWREISDLEGELRHAQRPLWRKLVRRP